MPVVLAQEVHGGERRDANTVDLAPAIAAGTDGLRILHGDEQLRELHKRFLPEPSERRRGEIDEIRATASAKLAEAFSIEEAFAWLEPAERTAVLLDRALLDWLATLPSAADESGRAPDAAAGAGGRNG